VQTFALLEEIGVVMAENDAYLAQLAWSGKRGFEKGREWKMKYLGSKARIADEILPIILRGRGERYYVEPFCGGCNTLCKVPGKRIGGDIHAPLIEMWWALQRGWEPPDHVSEDLYYEIKYRQDKFPAGLVGYVGFCSWGGTWFGGYPRDKLDSQDYWKNFKKNVMAQVPLLRGVEFCCVDYRVLEIPPKSVIYCDPPYLNSMGYKVPFVWHRFLQWLREKKEEGHIVYLSHNTELDFECIWHKNIHNKLGILRERLYRI